MKILAIRRVVSLLALTSLLTAVSCGDDEQEKKTIIISVPESAIPAGHDIWFFITNKSGKLLSVQEALKGFDVKFEIPAGEKVTLNKLTYVNTTTVTDFRIFAYTNVSPGKYSLSPITTPELVETGFHYLELSGVPAGYTPRAAGPNVFGCNYSSAGGNFSIKSAITSDNSKLVYYMSSLTDHALVPRYKLYPEADIEDSEILAFADMTIADKITINFDKQVDAAGVNITAGRGTSPLEDFGMNNVTSVPLYYPGTVFDSYRTRIDVVEDGGTYSYLQLGMIPTAFKKIPVTINSVINTDQQLTVNISGSFDYLYAYKLSEWATGTTDHYLDWLVYLDDQTEAFHISEIPNEIIARYPELETMPSADFNQLFLYEADDLTGYDGYLKRILNPDLPSTTTFTQSVSLRKIFAAPSGRKRQLPE